MHIDVILDSRARGDELAALAIAAEAAGIRGLWVSSLLDGRDPFVNLVPAAQATSRLLLGPIAVNPYESHPVRIAAALLSFNEIAGGRARLVVGGGGEALEALGIEPEKRVGRVGECVEILRRAATGQPVDYSGNHYQVQGLKFGWVTAPPPPLYVGANQQQMLAMAARCADGIMMSDAPAQIARQIMDQLDSGLKQTNRLRDGFEVNMFTAWHVYEDRRQALDEARSWLFLRGIFRPWLLETFLDPAEVDLIMASRDKFFAAFRAASPEVEGIPEALLDKLALEVTLCGDRGDLPAIVARLSELESIGLSSIALRLYAAPATSIQMLKDIKLSG